MLGLRKYVRAYYGEKTAVTGDRLS